MLHDRLRPVPSTKAEGLAAQLVGKSLQLPVGSSPQRTVALFVSSTCRFCTRSMEFYRQLSKARTKAPCEFRLVVMGPNEVETKDNIRDYLAKNELTVDESNVVDFIALGIPATPTLVIGDSSRKVRHAWVGLLDQEGQDDVISKINASCRA
jgi:hypothetical protein